MNVWSSGSMLFLASIVTLAAAHDAGAWTERMANSQNTNNVGDVDGLTPETARPICGSSPSTRPTGASTRRRS